MRRLGSIRSYAKHLRIDGVKDTIAIASGKGGVGKSTTAVNLAVALATKCHLKVGLLDADVYGPSIPTMMNINTRPEVTHDKKMIPIENYGIKCMSIGFLVEKDAPIVWRGPMVSNALEKMTRGVDWGNLDILVMDMPPGTGDVQIAMSQNLQLSGALIVSTPQDVALMDARRGVKMFNKVDVPACVFLSLSQHLCVPIRMLRMKSVMPTIDISTIPSYDMILGIVENMSCFKCPHCGEPSYIFGKGGAQGTASEMGLEFLGEIPLEVEVREACDQGHPIVLTAPDSVVSRAYGEVAEKVAQKLKEQQFQPEIIL
ncbi:Iron-sulfur protein NUBPL [Spatholobus suberectus]|nr:Iron-sulfur protein NUBPL [Spatholobus suberectus]